MTAINESIEYELVDLSFSIAYEQPEEDCSRYACEDSPFEKDDLPKPNVDDNGIPMGGSIQEIKIRERMIQDFFKKWGEENQNRKVFNEALADYIHIKSISVIEAKEHSAKSYLSTRAVFMLDEVLKSAQPVRRIPIKKENKNQAVFAYMLVMVYRHSEIGTIKLTVGVKSSEKRIEYGISTLRPGQSLIDNPNKQKSKKRCSH